MKNVLKRGFNFVAFFLYFRNLKKEIVSFFRIVRWGDE